LCVTLVISGQRPAIRPRGRGREIGSVGQGLQSVAGGWTQAGRMVYAMRGRREAALAEIRSALQGPVKGLSSRFGQSPTERAPRGDAHRRDFSVLEPAIKKRRARLRAQNRQTGRSFGGCIKCVVEQKILVYYGKEKKNEIKKTKEQRKEAPRCCRSSYRD